MARPDAGQGKSLRAPVLVPLARFDLTPDRPIMVHVHDYTRGQQGGDMHPVCELGVVLDGRLDRNHGSGWSGLGVGQAWACTVLEPHRWRAGRRGARVLVFGFLPELFDRMPDLEGFDPTASFRWLARRVAIGAGRAFRRALASLGRELAGLYRVSGPRAAPGLLAVDLQRVLALVSQEVVRGNRRVGTRSWLFDARRIQPALDLVDRCPSRSIPVDEAARACTLGRSTFDRHFKEVMGFGFAAYALRWRLARAAHALRSANLPIKAIAYRFGFKHVSHFSSAFVAHYAVPPGRYRRDASGPAQTPARR